MAGGKKSPGSKPWATHVVNLGGGGTGEGLRKAPVACEESEAGATEAKSGK